MYTFLTTMCPGSSDPFYIVSYYIKWVTTSWTHVIIGIHQGNVADPCGVDLDPTFKKTVSDP